MKRNIILIFIGIFLFSLMGGSRLWGYLNRPFNLAGFLKMSGEQGFLIDVPDNLSAFIKENSIIINNTDLLRNKNIIRKAYLVDAESISKALFVPFSWRNYAKSVLLGGGAAFACDQIFILDGSILARSTNDFAARISGISIDMLKTPPGKVEDYFMFTFVHEFTHIQHLHFRFTEDGRNQVTKWFNQGNRYLHENNYQLAIQEYENILRVCPAYYKAIDHVALAERRSGNISKSISFYKKSLSLNPGNTIARQNLVIAMVNEGLFSNARVHIDYMTKNDKENPEAPFWLGILNLRLKEYSKARISFLESIRLYKKSNNYNLIHANIFLIGLAQMIDKASLQDTLNEFEDNCDLFNDINHQFSQYCEMSKTTLANEALHQTKYVADM